MGLKGFSVFSSKCQNTAFLLVDIQILIEFYALTVDTEKDTFYFGTLVILFKFQEYQLLTLPLELQLDLSHEITLKMLMVSILASMLFSQTSLAWKTTLAIWTSNWQEQEKA